MARGWCEAGAGKPIAIKASRVLTVTKGTIEDGVVIVRDGKIVAVGKQSEVAIPPDAEVMDAAGKWLMPGQVDIHSHLGSNSGLHDYVHSLNPELTTWEYVNPEQPEILDDIASGVTTLLTVPGSGGNHSGWGVLWKLGGGTREELVLRRLGVMKIAQAWNPERTAGDLGRSRMGMWWMFREFFARAKKQLSEPPVDGRPAHPDLENVRAVLEKKTPVYVHCADARDLVGAMRLFHDELGLPLILSHCEAGAFRVGAEAARRGVHVNVGPRNFDFSWNVYDRKFYSIPLEYVKRGANVSLNTDSPVIPGEDLAQQGTNAVRMGLDEETALRAVTINPAAAMGIGDRVGSIEVGKDADLILKRGSLFDPRTPVELTMISGKVVYRYGQPRKGVGRLPQAAPPHTYPSALSNPTDATYPSDATAGAGGQG